MLRSLWTHVSQLKKIKVLQSSFQPSPSQTRHVWSKSDPTVWTRGWSDWGMAAMEWTLNVSTYIETHGLKLTTFQTSHLETIPKHPLIYKKRFGFVCVSSFLKNKALQQKKWWGDIYNNNTEQPIDVGKPSWHGPQSAMTLPKKSAASPGVEFDPWKNRCVLGHKIGSRIPQGKGGWTYKTYVWKSPSKFKLLGL